jgi:hypothetical protein
MNVENDASELCPVCGYALGFPAWSGDSASDEICPCCGIQFGYYDAAPTPAERVLRHDRWRERWIELGLLWDEGQSEPPRNWNPKDQLRRIGQTLAPTEEDDQRA